MACATWREQDGARWLVSGVGWVRRKRWQRALRAAATSNRVRRCWIGENRTPAETG